MLTKRTLAAHLLSARERDCLRLLRSGLQTSEVAANLGISRSTLNKHLAAARMKLGVNRTIHALLAMPNRSTDPRQNFRHEDDTVERAAARSPFTQDFANAIAACGTFDSAWNALQAHTRALGIAQANFGVTAEPAGQFVGGTKLIRSTIGAELQHMYRQAGGTAKDPVARYFSTQERPNLFDSEIAIRRQFADAPRPLLIFLESCLDHHMRQLICLPGRDNATNASFGLVFSLSPGAVSQLPRRLEETIDLLTAAKEVFWRYVQSKSLLADFAGLTSRQREALTFAVRGFTAAEAAEQMGVSTRATEKTLAAARERLGASTTTGAVYRAMVYRALT